MKSTSVSSFLFGIILVIFISETLGHSYVTNPITRSNQRQSNTGCRGPTCLGPCDRPVSGITRAPISVKRGDSISVEWPRNNHAGGFIRLAWAETSQSDSHAAFDAGVQQINCHEVGGCGPDNAADPNGGDSGPGDGSSRACKVSIKVPSHLPDGKFTLQWAWFGGAFALGDYFSCVDYIISGGNAIAPKQSPAFFGGDFTYPGQQKCKFFNTDRLHRCVMEPCDNPVYPGGGEKSGLPYMEGPVGVSVPVAPATTGRNVPVAPATTGRVIPATTGRNTPVAPATTGRNIPATTGRNIPDPTPNPIPNTPATPTPTNAPCTLGQQRCFGDNQFQACTWASRTQTGWSTPISCAAGLGCHSFQDNYILCY